MVDVDDVRLKGPDILKSLLVIWSGELISIKLFKLNARNANDAVFVDDFVVIWVRGDDQTILPMHKQSHAEIVDRCGHAINFRWICIGK